MKTTYIIMLAFFLSGCAANTPYYASGSIDAAAKHCNDLANARGYVGRERANFRTYCLDTLGNAPVAVIQEPSLAYNFASGLAAANPGYGRADAFGPYGVWGPTWQSFNQQFATPPPQPTLLLPLSPGQTPIILIPQ